MKKLSWITLMSTIAVSVTLLFGGWFLYRDQLKEGPLQSTIAALPNVAAVDVEWQPKQLMISLNVESNADLRTTVQQAYSQALKQADERNINIQVTTTHSNDQLEEWWSQALFPVAEAMAHQKFSMLPDQLDQLASKTPNMKVKTEMDEHFVYLTITDGQGCKMVVLPLEGEQMGVWPSEQTSKVWA